MFERRSGAAAAALHGQIYAGVLSGDQSGYELGSLGCANGKHGYSFFFQIKILLRSWTTPFKVQKCWRILQLFEPIGSIGLAIWTQKEQILWASGPTFPKHRGLKMAWRIPEVCGGSDGVRPLRSVASWWIFCKATDQRACCMFQDSYWDMAYSMGHLRWTGWCSGSAIRSDGQCISRESQEKCPIPLFVGYICIANMQLSIGIHSSIPKKKKQQFAAVFCHIL